MAVFTTVFITNNADEQPAGVVNRESDSEVLTDPLDTLSSADIAVNIAQLARLDETTAVTNNADSQQQALNIVPADPQVIAKPQIVETEEKSVADVQQYVVTAEDNVQTIAEKFNISQDSVRWSNDVDGDDVEVGATLTISPVEGFVYEVQDGDSVESIASKYSANEQRIIAFNDIELTGLVAGESIVIPDGKIPAPVVRSTAVAASVAAVPQNRPATYGYNGYVFGYCTYHVANKISVPVNWGNAKWWDDSAARTPGWNVLYSPAAGEVPAGAILVSNRGYYGHVAYVEQALPDGSLLISEMNANWNWNVLSTRVVAPGEVGAYNYIVRY